MKEGWKERGEKMGNFTKACFINCRQVSARGSVPVPVVAKDVLGHEL